MNDVKNVKKKWSDFEITALRSSYEAGLRTKQIARRLNRSWDSVNKALSRFSIRTPQRTAINFPKTGTLPQLVCQKQLPLDPDRLWKFVKDAFKQPGYMKHAPSHNSLIVALGLEKLDPLGKLPMDKSRLFRLENLSSPLPIELEGVQNLMPKNFDEVIQWVQANSGVEITKTICPGHHPFYSIRDPRGQFNHFQHSLLSQSQVLVLINKYRKNIGLKIIDIHDILYKGY